MEKQVTDGIIDSNRSDCKKVQALEKRKLGSSIEGGDSQVELVKEAQSFLDRVDDLVQVLLWVIHCSC